MLLSPEILQKICPSLPNDKANLISRHIETIAPKYNMYNVDVLREWIAQVAHESGEFAIQEENMNYTAERITEVWPTRFKTSMAAAPFAHSPQKLANFVYGGRMGNYLPDDGWTFRGSGPQQLTGRYSFAQYCKYESIDTPEDAANLIRTDYYWGIDSACWEFAVDKKLVPITYTHDFLNITKAINGGTIGLEDRKHYRELAFQYIN